MSSDTLFPEAPPLVPSLTVIQGDKPDEAESEPGEFDWHRDPSIVLEAQLSIAVYVNPRGAIVIRQEQSWADNDDPFILIRPEHAIAFVKRFLVVAGMDDIELVRRCGGG